MKGKMGFTISIILVMLGIITALIPNIPEILNRFDDKIMLSVLGALLAYVGLALGLLVKLRERRLKALKKGKQVFLMYSAQEKEKVGHIASELIAKGFDVWFDFNNILPGQIVEKQINAALESSAAVVLFISNAEIDSHIKKELEVYLRRVNVKDESFIPIVPVIIGEVAPPDMFKNVMCVNYDDKELMNKLASSLHSILG